ncbi:MAG: Rap1a/Tai family immunity protein [Alcanivorax sp.]
MISHSKILAVVFLCVFCLCVTFSSKAYSAQFSGEYLIKVCSMNKYGEEIIKGGKIACQAYIAGVIDYHNMLRAMDLTSDMNFCIPKDVSLNEIHTRVLAYMYERAKLHRKFVAAPGVAMALFSIYPCGK